MKILSSFISMILISFLIIPIKVSTIEKSSEETEMCIEEIEFETITELETYIENLQKLSYSLESTDINMDNLKNMNSFYYPESFNLSDLLKIVVYPTCIKTCFNVDGVLYELFFINNSVAIEAYLENAKWRVKAASDHYLAKAKKIDEITIYSHKDSGDSYYGWEQDEYYFELVIYGTKQKDEFYKLCTAVEYKLFSSNIQNSGFIKKDGKIYYIKSNGSYTKGWQTIEEEKYYFKKDGSAIVKTSSINGIVYKFNSDGVCLGKYTGWIKSGGNYYYYKNGKIIGDY